MYRKFLYCACEDGAIYTFKVKKNSIQMLQVTARADSPCYSICYVPPKAGKKLSVLKAKSADADSSDESEINFDMNANEREKDASSPVRLLFTGHQDGTIRKHDLITKQNVLTFKAQRDNTMVWALKLNVKRNMLVAGHASGLLAFWDSENGTLIQKIDELKADVLTIEMW